MLPLNILDVSLPLTNPVLKFLVILVIILFAPLILNKLKIPHLLGLIIAGAVIGPFGINLLERDSSIILSGTAGLLYIMFLAGLEIDMADFKKNRTKSLVFGLYTFLVPMILGILAGIYLLQFSVFSSILMASMFASHTLIAYPLVSKLGVAKNRAVNITVGGTVITDTLALLVLAVIVGMTTGVVNSDFWLRLSFSIILFALIIIFLFPIIARWFFKTVEDGVSQYIFVLVMVYLGAVLAELAGIEAIIGAFLAGLALNKLIPSTSPLMNRVEFIGNAIFIPFFLIGVGMLVNYRVFLKDFETLKVSAIMIIVATLAKFLAAWLTQKTFRFSADERRLIFGLSNAQAAATLAAVLVGYNIIIGNDELGNPIRLLNESVLNGTILMILFTCTIATLVAQKGAKNIAILENTELKENDSDERILIAINHLNITERLINLGITIKAKNNLNGIYALNILDINENGNQHDVLSKKILSKASEAASATGNIIHPLLRYDLHFVNGITSVVKENKITDIILGVPSEKGISDNFFSNLTEGILTKVNSTILVFKPIQPISTFKRHIIVVPENAEKEIGFAFWLVKIWNIAKNTGAKMVFYANTDAQKFIKEIQSKHPVNIDFQEYIEWEDFLILARSIQLDDNLILVMSRKEKASFHQSMSKIPHYLNKYFSETSYVLVYPMQLGVNENEQIDLTSATIIEPLEKLGEIGKTIVRTFKLR